jgi:hypothetical protein
MMAAKKPTIPEQPEVPEWDANPEPADVVPIFPEHVTDIVAPPPIESVQGAITGRDALTRLGRSQPETFVKARAMGKHTQQMVEYVRATPEIYGSDADAASDEIVGRTLQAASVEDVLDTGELTDAESVLGVNLEIWGVKFNESDFQEGSPVYAIIDAFREDTQQRDLIGCGGQRLVAQLVRFHQLNQWPVKCCMVKTRRPTKAGYFPLMLRSPM